MENRFGLEDINECGGCGEETLCEAFCPACYAEVLDVREAQEDAETDTLGDAEPLRF